MRRLLEVQRHRLKQRPLRQVAKQEKRLVLKPVQETP